MEEPKIIMDEKNSFPTLKIALILIIFLSLVVLGRVFMMANQERKVGNSKASESTDTRVTIEGTFIQGYLEDVKAHKMKVMYTLQKADGSMVSLNFVDPKMDMGNMMMDVAGMMKTPFNLIPGARIQLKGGFVGTVFVVDSTDQTSVIRLAQGGKDAPLITGYPSPSPVIGPKRIIVLNVNDARSPYQMVTNQDLEDKFFTNPTRSGAGYVRDNSMGRADFVPASTVVKVFGPYHLTTAGFIPTPQGNPTATPTPASLCDTNNWWIQDAAIYQAMQDPNFTSHVTFQAEDRIVVYFNSPCGYALSTFGTFGMATQPNAQGLVWMSPSVFYLSTTENVIGMIGHEVNGHSFFGDHSLGLNCPGAPLYVSPTIIEPWMTITPSMNQCQILAGGESDVYDTLGSVIGGHFNAFHKAEMGWLTDNVNIRTVTASGEFTIYPIETTTYNFKAIKVPGGPGSNDFVFAEFRANIGYDGVLSTLQSDIFNGALLHTIDNGGNHTYLLDMSPISQNPPYGTPDFLNTTLHLNQTFRDPVTNNCIKTTAVTPGVSLTLHVDIPCVGPTNTPTPIPPTPTRTPTPPFGPTCIPRPQCLYVTLPPGVHKRCYMPEPTNMCP
jgi:hypothetical protein